jgi:hypothetical protein
LLIPCISGLLIPCISGLFFPNPEIQTLLCTKLRMNSNKAKHTTQNTKKTIHQKPGDEPGCSTRLSSPRKPEMNHGAPWFISGFLGLLNLVKHPGSYPVFWDCLTLWSTLVHLRFSGTT